MVDFSAVLRRLPSRGDLAGAIDGLQIAREAVTPFVPGETVQSAVAAVADIMAEGMSASIGYLPPADAEGTARLVHLQTIGALSAEDLAYGNDLTVALNALGLGRASGDSVRTEVAAVCTAAAGAGMTVTFAGVRHDVVGEALAIRADLADEFPDLGVTIGANLHRSEGDCLDLAAAGARVRLIKREAPEPGGVAFTNAHEIDKAYVRALKLLLTGGARTTLFTHDARLIEIAMALGDRADREPGHYGFQFRRGLVPERAAEIVAMGASVGVFVPFGPDWATYMSQRITLSPAAVGQAARAAVSRGGAR
jgi:proline dehydrogenase